MRHKSAAAVAADYGLSIRTVRKWKRQYVMEGAEALADASSRPKRSRCSLTSETLNRMHALRKERNTGEEIALFLGLCQSTVFRGLCKLGLSRLTSLEPKPEVRRYEWNSPGDMLHVDIKGLAILMDWPSEACDATGKRRKPDWEYLHVCVYDRSRLHIQRSTYMRHSSPRLSSSGSQ